MKLPNNISLLHFYYCFLTNLKNKVETCLYWNHRHLVHNLWCNNSLYCKMNGIHRTTAGAKLRILLDCRVFFVFFLLYILEWESQITYHKSYQLWYICLFYFFQILQCTADIFINTLKKIQICPYI